MPNRTISSSSATKWDSSYASEIWVTGLYWRRAAKLTGSKLLSTVLLVVCFALQIGMVYFAGRVVGEMVPFYKS